jgi:hypothetical protein
MTLKTLEKISSGGKERPARWRAKSKEKYLRT